MAARAPGQFILDHVEIVERVLVYKKRIPNSPYKVGDAVPVRANSSGKPMYSIKQGLYRPDFLIKAVREQDAEWIDNPYTKTTAQNPRVSSLSARDKAIYAALKDGQVYADIGATYGVSRQRIKQIVDKLALHGLAVSAKAERMEARAAEYKIAKESKFGASHVELTGNPELLYRLSRRITAKRNNAKQRGIEFNLTPSDLYPLPERCPVLDIPLNYDDTRGGTDNAMSIDRVDPALGYVKGNIVLVSQRANRIKNDATVDELLKIAAFYSALEVKSV